MQAFSKAKHAEGKRIGLVPTMGFLHEGHLSLIRKAKESCDITVVSIFVNPTQFAPNEDFSKYPRDEVRDQNLLINEKVDVLFMPSVEEIYPPGFQSYVEITELSKKQEGEFRPTHFKGVTTIVSILFNSVQPDVAVFGQKDAQQAEIIKRMVYDLKFNIEIFVAPILRDIDGLALSSRNVYLSADERQDALILYKSLLAAKGYIEQGEYNALIIINKMKSLIASVASSNLDYVKMVNISDFEEQDKLVSGHRYYILIACRFGNTRLIDNLLIEI